MIDSIISRHVTRSNTSFRPSCFLTFVDQRGIGNSWKRGTGEGSAWKFDRASPLDLSFIDPTRGRRLFLARFRIRSVCGCIVCDHINLHFESPRMALSLSLSLHTPSFPSIHLAPSTVSLLFAPRDRFRRSVPIKAAAYCIQIGSKLSSFVVHPPCSFCCCRYVAPSCSLIKLHPSIL